MVVAAGAGDGHAEKRLAEHVDLVVDAVGLIGAGIDGRVLGFAQPPEAGGEDRFVEKEMRPLFGAAARAGQQVAGQVLADELIVGHVVIESADQVVAILPGVGNCKVELVALRLGVAHHVEPMPRPALAIMGRVKEAIDDLFED